jgi:anti-sigma factor RsiW
MRCPPFDLKDYLLAELSERESRQVEAHVKTCQTCREELERLRATQSALLSAVDEEVPRRIAFVSDKVFEPSPWRRAWQSFWGSTARLGFVAAAMLMISVLVSTLAHPKPAPAPAAAPAVDVAKLQADFDQRLAHAVGLAVAASEARQEQKTAGLLKAQEQRAELERKAVMLAMEENLEVLRKKLNVMILASNDYGAAR